MAQVIVPPPSYVAPILTTAESEALIAEAEEIINAVELGERMGPRLQIGFLRSTIILIGVSVLGELLEEGERELLRPRVKTQVRTRCFGYPEVPSGVMFPKSVRPKLHEWARVQTGWLNGLFHDPFSPYHIPTAPWGAQPWLRMRRNWESFQREIAEIFLTADHVSADRSRRFRRERNTRL